MTPLRLTHTRGFAVNYFGINSHNVEPFLSAATLAWHQGLLWSVFLFTLALSSQNGGSESRNHLKVRGKKKSACHIIWPYYRAPNIPAESPNHSGTQDTKTLKNSLRASVLVKLRDIFINITLSARFTSRFLPVVISWIWQEARPSPGERLTLYFSLTDEEKSTWKKIKFQHKSSTTAAMK